MAVTTNPNTLTPAELKRLKALMAKQGAAAKSPAAKKAVAKKAPAKPVAAPIESEIRFSLEPYGEGVGIDVRTWRKIKGEWIPGKGLRFAIENADVVLAGIAACVEEHSDSE